jgi:hypothetical protein
MAVPSYEEMKDKFQSEVGQKAVQDYINKLQADAHIEIKPADGAAKPADKPADAPADKPADKPETAK